MAQNDSEIQCQDTHVNDEQIDVFMLKFGYKWNDAQDMYENKSSGYDVPGDFASDVTKYAKALTAYKDKSVEEALLKGRLIQAQATFDKWKWYKEQNRQLDFDVFLSGQVDSHDYELRLKGDN